MIEAEESNKISQDRFGPFRALSPALSNLHVTLSCHFYTPYLEDARRAVKIVLGNLGSFPKTLLVDVNCTLFSKPIGSRAPLVREDYVHGPFQYNVRPSSQPTIWELQYSNWETKIDSASRDPGRARDMEAEAEAELLLAVYETIRAQQGGGVKRSNCQARVRLYLTNQREKCGTSL